MTPPIEKARAADVRPGDVLRVRENNGTYLRVVTVADRTPAAATPRGDIDLVGFEFDAGRALTVAANYWTQRVTA